MRCFRGKLNKGKLFCKIALSSRLWIKPLLMALAPSHQAILDARCQRLDRECCVDPLPSPTTIPSSTSSMARTAAMRFSLS
jgi:hypothetical protein